MGDKLWYAISGINPEPWTASEGSVGRNKSTGRLFVQFHKPSQVRMYQEALIFEFAKEYPDAVMTTEPCALHLCFWRQLAQSQGATRKVRAHAADATNLQKSTEDALQGLLYKNDSQIIYTETWIVEQSESAYPRILIALELNPVVPQEIFVKAAELPWHSVTSHASNIREVQDDLF